MTPAGPSAAKSPQGKTRRSAKNKAVAETPEERTRRLLMASGLTAPLAPQQPDLFIRGTSTAAQREAMELLDANLTSHCEGAADSDRLATALAWFSDFQEYTGRVPFKNPNQAGNIEYNQRTLDLFAEFIRAAKSRQRGRTGATIRADTISGYVSAIKTAVTRAQRQPITSPDRNILLPLALKQMRREQPPDGGTTSRTLKMGIRARHLREIAERWDKLSRKGAEMWAAALLAHNLLLRGGEVGRSAKRAWDRHRGITLASFIFKEPCPESDGCPWLFAIIVAIKDTYVRNLPMRIPIRRRSSWDDEPIVGADPMDVYDAILIAWRMRAAEVPPDQFDSAPFFTSRDSRSPWTTQDSKDLARSVALKVGIDPSLTGGKSFRIGGATDMREALGDGSQNMIQQRGRWATDIARIYQRALVRSHLEASVAMGSAHASRDLEEISKGAWAQPAW